MHNRCNYVSTRGATAQRISRNAHYRRFIVPIQSELCASFALASSRKRSQTTQPAGILSANVRSYSNAVRSAPCGFEASSYDNRKRCVACVCAAQSRSEDYVLVCLRSAEAAAQRLRLGSRTGHIVDVVVDDYADDDNDDDSAGRGCGCCDRVACLLGFSSYSRAANQRQPNQQ